MNNRERMRISNKLAVKWCLEHGIDDIWLKPHGKRTDTHYCKRGNYRALDLFGLFDGIAWFDRKIVFLQIVCFFIFNFYPLFFLFFNIFILLHCFRKNKTIFCLQFFVKTNSYFIFSLNQ